MCTQFSYRREHQEAVRGQPHLSDENDDDLLSPIYDGTNWEAKDSNEIKVDSEIDKDEEGNKSAIDEEVTSVEDFNQMNAAGSYIVIREIHRYLFDLLDIPIKI